MQPLLVLLGEKAVLVFRYGGCSVTRGCTLVVTIVRNCALLRRNVQEEEPYELAPSELPTQNFAEFATTDNILYAIIANLVTSSFGMETG